MYCLHGIQPLEVQKIAELQEPQGGSIPALHGGVAVVRAPDTQPSSTKYGIVFIFLFISVQNKSKAARTAKVPTYTCIVQVVGTAVHQPAAGLLIRSW